MRTLVYVDGVNLYYGVLKPSGCKWLDLVALCEKVLAPHHDILGIKYFTARGSLQGSGWTGVVHHMAPGPRYRP